MGGTDADQRSVVLDRQVVQRVSGRSADEQRAIDPVGVERVECGADVIAVLSAPSARPSSTAHRTAPGEPWLPS